MAEFIHTADWHLGNPFSAFTESQQQALGAARFEAVSRLFTYARESGVRLILCAGDQIDNGELRDTAVLLKLFGTIGSFPEVQVVMIAGNHDPLTPTSVYRRVKAESYPKNLHFVEEPRSIDLPEHGIRLLAAPLAARYGRTNPIVGLGSASREEARDKGGELVTVALAHGSLSLSEAVEGADAFPIPPALAEEAGLDYVALGDWHSFLASGARTFYPGTHEPLAFGDEAGSLHVKIDHPGARPVVTRVAEPVYRWRELERSVTDEGLDSLLAEIGKMVEGGERERTVARLALEGYLSLERYKELEERLSIAETQLFALFVAAMPAVRPDESEIRAIASEGYMEKVVERLLSLAGEGDTAAETALLRVHEFFREKTGRAGR